MFLVLRSTLSVFLFDLKFYSCFLSASFGIVIIAIIVLLIVYFVNPKFKEKVQNFFRSLKSELNKVVWSSKDDVKKNTIVVLIFVAAFAVLIGLLDFLFSKGIIALGKLF